MRRKFKSKSLGYFHTDIIEVRTLQGRPNSPVAIDGTTKSVFVERHEKATTRIA